MFVVLQEDLTVEDTNQIIDDLLADKKPNSGPRYAELSSLYMKLHDTSHIISTTSLRWCVCIYEIVIGRIVA